MLNDKQVSVHDLEQQAEIEACVHHIKLNDTGRKFIEVYMQTCDPVTYDIGIAPDLAAMVIAQAVMFSAITASQPQNIFNKFVVANA